MKKIIVAESWRRGLGKLESPLILIISTQSTSKTEASRYFADQTALDLFPYTPMSQFLLLWFEVGFCWCIRGETITHPLTECNNDSNYEVFKCFIHWYHTWKIAKRTWTQLYLLVIGSRLIYDRLLLLTSSK